MANPVTVKCKKGIWKLVAENVVSGQVKKSDRLPNLYLETYRTHSGAAPTKQNEGIPIFLNGNSEIISASSGIDVYIMAVDQDGRVRVDI